MSIEYLKTISFGLHSFIFIGILPIGLKDLSFRFPLAFYHLDYELKFNQNKDILVNSAFQTFGQSTYS